MMAVVCDILNWRCRMKAYPEVAATLLATFYPSIRKERPPHAIQYLLDDLSEEQKPYRSE